MNVVVVNRQRKEPIRIREVRIFAQCVFDKLGVREQGIFTIAFVGPRAMRRLNRVFLKHDWVTDVIAFRYGQEPAFCAEGAHALRPVGEVIIAPGQARDYVRAHGGAYAQEVRRYVAHGILHWLGWQDDSPAQKRRMRREEDRLLRGCR